MDSLDYWRLCDELNIIQAAHLLIGMVPGEVEAMFAGGSELTGKSRSKYIIDLNAAQTAITNALRRGSIQGNIVPNTEFDINGNSIGFVVGTINPEESQLEVASLKRWLAERGFTTGFFFPDWAFDCKF